MGPLMARTWAWLLLLLPIQAESLSPEFVSPVSNVSVARGRDAKFTCLVRHLGGFRVGWVKADTKAIQAIHTHVITHNPRVHVNFDDHSTWHLMIKQVTEEDQGPYMCQINTDPMISQMGFLEVLRPPEIDDEDSSGDVVVTEGESAILRCVARGHPTPTVTWVREDNASIMVSDGVITKSVTSWEGETLELTRVSRDDMGAYLCIARNAVPPQVSKRVLLHVHFHPIIRVPNQLIGSPYGNDVHLECRVEASPKPVTYWTNPQGDMLMGTNKYVVKEKGDSNGYAVIMTLQIRDLTSADVGYYNCVAKNSIGEVESSINVYYIAPPTTTSPPRVSPNFVETNRLEDEDLSIAADFFPGIVALGEENSVGSSARPGGTGGDRWLARPRDPPVSPGDIQGFPGLRNWHPGTNQVDDAAPTETPASAGTTAVSTCHTGYLWNCVLSVLMWLSAVAAGFL